MLHYVSISRLAVDFGKESMMSLQHLIGSRYTPVILTGPLKLDLVLGIGGLLKNGRKDGIGYTGIHSRHHSSVVEVSEYECDELHDAGKVVEKDAALRLAVSRLAGDFGKESMLSLQRFFGSRYTPVISTGSLKLDLALGIGGLPKGRIVEIFGREASGKTTIGLHIIKEAQKLGGYCAYVDVENALDPALAESIGVNTENLLIARQYSAESSLSVVNTLAKSGSIDVIVVDSVAALVPQCELDVLIDGTCQEVQSQPVKKDGQSRLMNQSLRKIHSSLCQSQTLLIFINQVRSNLISHHGFGYANEVTCGGNALKFYAAVRMRIRKTGLIKSENEITGLGISVQVVKNKLAPAMREAEMEIRFGRGISCESEVLDLASKYGIISKEGNNYCIEGEIFKDKQEAEQYLAENDGVLDHFVTILRNQLFEGRR